MFPRYCQDAVVYPMRRVAVDRDCTDPTFVLLLLLLLLFGSRRWRRRFRKCTLTKLHCSIIRFLSFLWIACFLRCLLLIFTRRRWRRTLWSAVSVEHHRLLADAGLLAEAKECRPASPHSQTNSLSQARLQPL